MEPSIFEQLAAPFDLEAVSWRPGKVNGERCIPLAYIDARDVMDRLDGVVGPENWQDTYLHVGGAMCCRLSIRIDGEWITKSDGAGATNMEGEKGQFSDALKRAAVRWGIGRYLYGVKVGYVPIDQYKRITKDGLATCQQALAKASSQHEWGDRHQANLWRVISATIKTLAREPEDIGKLLKANEGHVAQLKVAYRKQLDQLCERMSDELRGQNARAA